MARAAPAARHAWPAPICRDDVHAPPVTSAAVNGGAALLPAVARQISKHGGNLLLAQDPTEQA